MGSSSYNEDFGYILFGYILGCGIADLIYISNKKRYLEYRMKITQKKIRRLRELMYLASPMQYMSQYGEDEIIIERKGCFQKLFHKEPSAAERAEMRLDRAKKMANIINSTYDFAEFVNSYAELIRNMEFLQSIENLSFFTGRKPSEDLAEIKEKRPLTEKEFIDRFMFQHGKESLAENRVYFDKLLPETVRYINSFLVSASRDDYKSKGYKDGNKGPDVLDDIIVYAGRFIIEKDKASIGMLQRQFKIGFNQAARIMDKLEEMGVVGMEEGTIPRRILVTAEEYESIVENYHPQKLNSEIEKETLIHDRVSLYNNKYDYMDGHDFEHFCADLLRKNGFDSVGVTQGSGDHGIDILAEKDGITYAIQCKCYSSNIGNSAVQQAHTGKSLYHKDIAVVLTNRYFTPQAIEEAKTLGVKLWDRDKLNKLIRES